MVIKSSLDAKGRVVGLWMILLLWIVYQSIYLGESCHDYWIAIALYMLMAILLTISLGRTLVFDEKGCVVCFLWIRKTYTWDELKIKRYVTYDGCFADSTFCKSAAEFCPKSVRVPKRMTALSYSSTFRPFRFFFVYFDPPADGSNTDRLHFDAPYKVDEQKFRAKLKEWNVDMEEVVRGGSFVK